MQLRATRKIWAVATAAATLLGGLALGAGTAHAADGDSIAVQNNPQSYPTLTVTSPAGSPDTVNGHKFTALRIGYYQGATEGTAPAGDNGDYAKAVDVRTDATTAGGAAQDTLTIIAGILPTIDEDANTAGVQNGYANSQYASANNPTGYISDNYLGYSGTANPTATAALAAALAADANIQKMIAVGNSDYNNIFSGTGATDASGQTATAYIERGIRTDGLPGVVQGVYLVAAADGSTQASIAGTELTGTSGADTSLRAYGVLDASGAPLSLGAVTAEPAAKEPSASDLQVTKQVALQNADGTLDGGYANEVTATKGQLVRYKATSSAPAEGLGKYAVGSDLQQFVYRIVDTPSAGQTVITKGGENPTDKDGNVLYKGTVPAAKFTFTYRTADGRTGTVDNVYTHTGTDNMANYSFRMGMWEDGGRWGVKDGRIQLSETTAYTVDSFVADGVKSLYAGISYGDVEPPADATLTAVSFEYSAVITAEPSGNGDAGDAGTGNAGTGDAGTGNAGTGNAGTVDVTSGLRMVKHYLYVTGADGKLTTDDKGERDEFSSAGTATVHVRKAVEPDPEPEPVAPQVTKQVALQNADGTLDGGYAAEVTATKGQLVRYKLTSDMPSKGFQSAVGETPMWSTVFVDAPAAGQTVLLGGSDPTDAQGDVVYEGDVPMARMTYSYENADGSSGSVAYAFDADQWLAKVWKDDNGDGSIQTAEVRASKKTVVAADGSSRLYLNQPRDWGFVNRQLPAGAHWTSVSLEYSAVITADSGDVANAFEVHQGSTDAEDGMPAISTAPATATVHAKPAPVPTFDLKFTVVDSASGKGIAGARFSLEENGAKASKTVRAARALASQAIKSSDSSLVDAAMPIAYVTEATSDAHGVVSFSGLPAGSYSITQTATADGYNADELPTFLVIIDSDGKASFTGTGAHADLVGADGTIRNVKLPSAITQLPLTGDDGVDAFVACMVLLAVVAGVGVIRLRSVRAGRSERA